MVCLGRPDRFNFLKAAFHKLYLVYYWILYFVLYITSEEVPS